MFSATKPSTRQVVVNPAVNANIRILVIDDDRVHGKIIYAMLQQAGYQVVVAFDGADGINQAERQRPDLIISDIVMPHLNGFEVSQQIRNHKLLAQVPMILLTGLTSLDGLPAKWSNKARLYQLGASRREGIILLTKPITATRLLEEVSAMLRVRVGARLGAGRGAHTIA